MKLFREMFGGLAGAMLVAMLTVAIVVCTFAIGFVSTVVRDYTQAEEQVPSTVQSDAALALEAAR